MRYIVLYILITCAGFCSSLEAQKPVISLLPQGHQLLQEIMNDTSTRPDTSVIIPATPAMDPVEKTKAEKKKGQSDSIKNKTQGRKKEKEKLSGLHPLRIRKYIVGFIFITALNI